MRCSPFIFFDEASIWLQQKTFTTYKSTEIDRISGQPRKSADLPVFFPGVSSGIGFILVEVELVPIKCIWSRIVALMDKSKSQSTHF